MPLLPTNIMTKHHARSGSSLLQTSNSHHNHLHIRDHSRSLFTHTHHEHSKRGDAGGGSKEKRQNGRDGNGTGNGGGSNGSRGGNGAGAAVTQVVQLTQFVDQNGVPITVVTNLATSTNAAADLATETAPQSLPTEASSDIVVPIIPTEISVDVPAPIPTVVVESSLPLPPVVDTLVNTLVPNEPPTSESQSETPIPTPATQPTLEPSSASNSTASTSEETSATSSETTTAFPTLAAPFNSTQGGFRNNTLYSNTTSIADKSKKKTSTTLLSSSEETATDAIILATDVSSPGAGNAEGGGQSSVGDGNGSGNNNHTVPTSTVVGSVVGGLAGAALIAFLIMALLRWKRRQSGRQKLEDGPFGSRAMITDGTTPGMAQRPMPLTVPGVLASLSGYKQQAKNSSTPAATREEKGFYRVSGKKLPSVLEHGGDGYTDPRQSVMSGASSHYSMFDGAEPSQRLALGSPMRPVSGVPIIRSGPARTPITEENPFSDPPTPSSSNLQPTYPNQHLPDPIGRSLTNQDSSRVSSRFTEEV